MKTMTVIIVMLGVLGSFFLLLQIFSAKSQRDIETYPYELVNSFETFEIRNYEASLFTSVRIPSNEYKKVSSTGFSILANYIFGNNKEKQKIAMTSPVAMTLEDTVTMMFMVPKEMNRDNLPQPNNSDIKFVEEPAKTVAVIRFGGWADDTKINKYKQQLIAALDEKGINHTNKFYFLGYNPPYEILNRRNEIMVELTNDV